MTKHIQLENERKHQVIHQLLGAYTGASIALTYSNPWELLVAVILSAQCTDVMVNKVTASLFQKYRSLQDYVNADLDEFEQDIKSTGFYRNKAKNILLSAKIIQETYHGIIPDRMDHLLKLPGVARKTANIVLGNIYGIAQGIAVDTHVHRISQRLRLVNLESIGGKKVIQFKKAGTTYVDYKKDADANKIERDLMNIVPTDAWLSFSYTVIEHGRAVCKAQNPQCNHCFLASLCPASRI